MSFEELFNSGAGSLVENTVGISLPAFVPELVLCATIVLILLARVVGLPRIAAFLLAMVGAIVALATSQLYGGDEAREVFTGLLVYDQLSVFLRGALLLFLVLLIPLTRLTGIPDDDDAPDFYTLLFGATVGMCLMVSANHLFMVFLAIEMASVPSYVMAGMMRRREASEAALKYSVYGAGTAGIMLYGISLLTGVLGSAHLPTLTTQLGTLLQMDLLDGDRALVLVLGGLMLMVGLAFKLAAVPFHFWCPDVFEGASAEVNAFLSVASKAAALGLLIRVAIGFAYVEELPPDHAMMVYAAQEESADDEEPAGDAAGEERVVAAPAEEPTEAAGTGSLISALRPVRTYIAALVGVLAAITCTFGNLAAYGQTNIKRLLAYSTIGHAGYMMMPVAAAMMLIGDNGHFNEAREAISAIAVYVGIYLFMNLGAFAIVALLRNELHSEEIADYAGLIKQCPGMVICFSIILFSLIGLPPLAGFNAKFRAFASLADAKLWTLLVIAGLNTVVSLFYYLRVVKTMTLEPAPDDRLPIDLSWYTPKFAYVAIITLPILILGVYWEGLNVWAVQASEQLFR